MLSIVKQAASLVLSAVVSCSVCFTSTKAIGAPLAFPSAIAKGGAGLIRHGIYIDVRSSRNSITIEDGDNHSKNWVGLAATDPEVILTDGRSISKSVKHLDTKQLVIIIFTPTEVRFIDLKNNNSNKYIR